MDIGTFADAERLSRPSRFNDGFRQRSPAARRSVEATGEPKTNALRRRKMDLRRAIGMTRAIKGLISELPASPPNRTVVGY